MALCHNRERLRLKMSFYFADSNNANSRELFMKRLIYRGQAALNAAKYQNFIDFNFAEKYLYGRVNREYLPITFIGSFTPLKSFSRSFAKTDNIQAANFVVDAFEAMARQFEKCVLKGQISPSDPFLSNLRVFKAHTSSTTVYGQYIDKYFHAVATQFQKANIRVKNFDEFIKELMILLQISAYETPFTETAFTKSKYCPFMANGLSLEIADADPTNDAKKIKEFLHSRNWEFYLKTCRTYGFMVDRMAPWRLVADIASNSMLEYAAKYRASTTEIILGTSYKETHRIYFEKFKYFLLKLYNKVKLQNFLVLEECGGRIISKQINPVRYTPEQFDNKYTDEYFLKLYCRIRFLEDESQFKAFKKDILIDDTIELFHIKGIDGALNKFEKIINKPFDYRGSLSYYIKYTKALKELEGP